MNPAKIIKNFISLGPNCCIRLRIDHYLKQKKAQYGETNLFDWNLVDSNCVVNLLNPDLNIRDYFFKDNFKTGNIDDKFFIELKNIYFKSIHDISPNLNSLQLEKEIENYIEKYTRRHKRFIGLLRSTGLKLFVYMADLNEAEFNKIKNKNKLYRKIFVCLDDYGENVDLLCKKNKNLYKINYYHLYNVKNKSTVRFLKTTNWTYMEFLNWDRIFDLLCKIYKENFKFYV